VDELARRKAAARRTAVWLAVLAIGIYVGFYLFGARA
jgi:hypothetical protein